MAVPVTAEHSGLNAQEWIERLEHIPVGTIWPFVDGAALSPDFIDRNPHLEKYVVHMEWNGAEWITVALASENPAPR